MPCMPYRLASSQRFHLLDCPWMQAVCSHDSLVKQTETSFSIMQKVQQQGCTLSDMHLLLHPMLARRRLARHDVCMQAQARLMRR